MAIAHFRMYNNISSFEAIIDMFIRFYLSPLINHLKVIFYNKVKVNMYVLYILKECYFQQCIAGATIVV